MTNPSGFMDGGDCKHSFHIICIDIVFESNMHGMKAFVMGFIRIPENNNFLQMLDDSGNLRKQCIVNTTVYTKNLCFSWSCSFDRALLRS
mmetsp:Transcript_33570/g.82514  ORF Transcript_33570/g.82514 Transcript_33570/m.82514 type:complete len:90 (+) Transcript_33570:1333-1602(+)